MNPENSTHPLLAVFDYQSSPIRIFGTAKDPQFIAADICRGLEIKNVSQALSRLDDDEKGIITNDTPSGLQEMLYVTLPGLVRLTAVSRKPSAKVFQRWLTHDVVPAIFHTGTYTLPGGDLPPSAPEPPLALPPPCEITEYMAAESFIQAKGFSEEDTDDFCRMVKKRADARCYAYKSIEVPGAGEQRAFPLSRLERWYTPWRIAKDEQWREDRTGVADRLKRWQRD